MTSKRRHPDSLAFAVDKIQDGFDRVSELMGEYESLLARLPGKDDDTPYGVRLIATVDTLKSAYDDLQNVIDELEELVLPVGDEPASRAR